MKYYKSTFTEPDTGFGLLAHNEEADTLETISKSEGMFGFVIFENGANEEMESMIPSSVNFLEEITEQEYEVGKSELFQKVGFKSVVLEQ